jgi:glucosamine--fructose-6-phosphate aminotransferase (isomerizing)
MCGIVGYIGKKNAIQIIINGLKRMEYRGYDSMGFTIIDENDKLFTFKKKGKISEIEPSINFDKYIGTAGIGHTRWATHGIPNDINAHPHTCMKGNIVLVHNGIIENYKIMKERLAEEGYTFVTDTDTEVLANLISYNYDKYLDFEKAVRLSLLEVEGTYGLAIVCQSEPDKLIVARKGSPLLIGVGNNETLVASDAAAVLNYTKNVVYLEDGEMAILTHNGYSLKTIEDKEVLRNIEVLDLLLSDIEKGGYDHFMLKEICEQSETLKNTFRGRINLETGVAKLGGLEPVFDKIMNARRIIITACGTAWHAGLVGEYMIEQYCRIPVEVEYASEFRYRRPIINRDDIVIAISQSGETADTLAAIREAKRHGATTIGIVNVIGSSIAREVDAGTYVHAGPEIGVASTKAFTSQLMSLALITMMLAKAKETIPAPYLIELAKELEKVPLKIQMMIDRREDYKKVAEKYKDASNFLYLGRGFNFPVALEGALKLKEISYIHAEGYAAAEMKHGPIALIDKNLPVVFIAPKDRTYDKIKSNIREVHSREGKIIVLASDDDDELQEFASDILRVPKTLALFAPILNVIPLQFLAYYMALMKGCNVDQPRNLSKSVTVE